MEDIIIDEWSKEKKFLNLRKDTNFFVNEREIWFTKMWINIGYEENGKSSFHRLVLVMKKIGNLFFTVALTSKWKSQNKFYYKLLGTSFNQRNHKYKDSSFCILSQVKVMDKKRFTEYMWKVWKQEFWEIKKKTQSVATIGLFALSNYGERIPKDILHIIYIIIKTKSNYFIKKENMISKIFSMSVNGLSSDVIEVEVDINNGLPSFTIVGLPDQWVQESKERLRSALKSTGNKLPVNRITVNLAPADIKKSWPSFDLPIAVWILLHQGIIDEEICKDSIFLWELSLDGKLRKISSVLPAVISAQEKWFKRIFVPKQNALEASIIPWIDIIELKNISELIEILNKQLPLSKVVPMDFNKFARSQWWDEKYDFKYIIGQEHAKRALEIAAAWGHNIIMDGPPGSGKTLLSKSFATILPDMTINEAIEVSKIYSISWMLWEDTPIIYKRPFRTVHHTASWVSIIWGGRNAKPWEISLAHKWVLFFDEILEFNAWVLEVLRQPLEDGTITVNRVNASYTYPAQFTLVWAMNPCPCWYLTDPDKDCVCSSKQVENYRARLSWPLMDRIDICIEVPKVKTQKLKVQDDYEWIEASWEIKKRVQKARNVQHKRFVDSRITCNSEMWTREINTFCYLSAECDQILKQAVASLNLSARAYYRIIKLARTIADLDEQQEIDKNHILEAISFRKKEENL